MRAWAALTLALLALPVSAEAGTVEVRQIDRYHSVLEVRGAQDEANDLAVRLIVTGDSGAVTVRDEASPLEPGSRCSRIDAHEATCPTRFFSQIDVAVGDGDDRVLLQLGPDAWALREVVVDGGAGDDQLLGDPNNQILRGGAGNDLLRAGAGYDRLDGGPGQDQLYGEGGQDWLDDGDAGTDLSADILVGGPDRDTLVSYRDRTQPVRIDLAEADGYGEDGENDSVAEVEVVDGGAGADVLLGDDRGNHFLDSPGGDTIQGRAGDDFIEAGDAGERIFSGAGADRISAPTGYDGRSVDCGDDADTINVRPLRRRQPAPDPRTPGPVLTGCERLRYPTFEVNPLASLSAGRLTVHFSAFSCCESKLALTRGTRRLGTKVIGARNVRFGLPRAMRPPLLRLVLTWGRRVVIPWRFRVDPLR